MIRGPLPLARPFVYPGGLAPRGQRRRHPDVIDPQAEVATKPAGAIVPPGIMAAFLCVQAKRIRESPVLDVLQGSLLRFAEQYAVLPQTRVVHITLFGRNVEIAAKQHRCVGS